MGSPEASPAVANNIDVQKHGGRVLFIGSVPAGGKPKTVTSLTVSLHLSLAVWLGRMGELYRSCPQVLTTSLCKSQ